MTIEVLCNPKEKEMFEKWIACEKEEWERLEYSGFETTECGIKRGEMSAIWQSDLYQRLQSTEEEFRHFFVYLFQFDKDEHYTVDIGFEKLDFRINISILDYRICGEIHFKEKDEKIAYYSPSKYLLIKSMGKEELKQQAEAVLFFYEKFKKVVLDHPSNRLRLLFEKKPYEEKSVVKLKGKIKSL